MGLRGAAAYVKSKTKWALTLAEVGVRSGFNAVAMLCEMDIKALYLIDHYNSYQDGPVNRSQIEQDEFYQAMFKNVHMEYEKVVLVTRPSLLAASLFEDRFFDFVYIDGDHSAEGVRKDLELWWPKIVKGGFLGGHDFGHQDYSFVKEVVLKFAEECGLFVKEMPEDDWILEKV